MVVYLDRLFLLNGLLDYLLLSACGRVTGTAVSRVRLGLAAAAGGLYAVCSLLPGFRFLGRIWWSAAFGAVLCLISFGPGRGLLRQTAVLCLLSAAFSGVVLALTELFSAPAALTGGRIYYPVTLGTLLLTGGGACGAMGWALGRLRQGKREIARVRVRLLGRSRSFTALRDTGNTLREPISGAPVLVAEGRLLEELLPGVRADLGDPAGAMEALGQACPQLRWRLIPYRAVGVPSGLLLGVRPEEVEIDGRLEPMFLAFAPGPVSDGGGYRALLGGSV